MLEEFVVYTDNEAGETTRIPVSIEPVEGEMTFVTASKEATTILGVSHVESGRHCQIIKKAADTGKAFWEECQLSPN